MQAEQAAKTARVQKKRRNRTKHFSPYFFPATTVCRVRVFLAITSKTYGDILFNNTQNDRCRGKRGWIEKPGVGLSFFIVNCLDRQHC